MAERRNPSHRIGFAKWIVFAAAIAFAALASSRTGTAQSLHSINQPLADTEVNRGSTPARIDPAGDEDPSVSFERSRRSRRTTIMAPRPVAEAHRRWTALHGIASSEQGAGNAASPSAAIGTNVDLPLTDYQGETAIAVNPNNPQQLVGGSNTSFADPKCPVPAGTNEGTQTLYGSTDGGTTWTVRCAPWPASLNGGKQNTSFGSDPAVAWDSAGNAYAAYLLVNESCGSTGCSDTTVSDAIEVAKSSDFGTTWTSLGQVVNDLGNTSVSHDKEFIAIDTATGSPFANRIYVIWDTFDAGTGTQVEQVAFSDNGTTWTTVPLDTGSTSVADIGGDLAIGPNGTVYAVWNQLGLDSAGNETSESTMFSQSLNGGTTWAPATTIATHVLLSFGANALLPAQNQRGINAFPAIAVDRDLTSTNLGHIYVVYDDFASSSAQATDTNVYFIRSTNKGVSWSSPIKVNDDSGTASQFFPWVDVDQSTGNIALSWYDTRNDPNNTRTQIFAAQSIDGGATFQANVQVTTPSAQFANNSDFSDENSADNSQANLNQYGDYAQIAFLNGIAHPLWCDSRDFFPSQTTNVLAEDAAAAQVNFSSSPTATPSATPTTTPTATPTSTPTPVSAVLRVSPKQANFRPQVTLGGQGGQNPKPVNAVIANPKAGKSSPPIQIQSVQISGTDFHFFPGSPANHCAGTLNPGNTCSIPMAFSPTQPGVRTGTLTITDNTAAGQHTIALRGTGKPGKLMYNPKSLSFSAAVGSTSGAKVVRLRNNNPVPLDVGSPSVNNPDFLLSGNCLGPIQPNSSCDENINFRPSKHGTVSATLTFPDNAAGAPHKVKLSGAGK